MVDPKKMAAWAGGQGGKPGADEMPDDAEEHDGNPEEHAAEEDEEDSGEALGPLYVALEKHIDEVEAHIEELDGDMLSEEELSPEEHQILQEGYAELPDDLREALEQHAAGISRDEAMQVADHLHDEDLVADPDRMAGWLYHIGMLAGA